MSPAMAALMVASEQTRKGEPGWRPLDSFTRTERMWADAAITWAGSQTGRRAAKHCLEAERRSFVILCEAAR